MEPLLPLLAAGTALAHSYSACVAKGMRLAGIHSSLEAVAKAALLNFLREQEMLNDAVIVSELELPSVGRRADLVVIGDQPVAIEIKSKADSLARLPDQLGTFCRAFPATYAAVATPHLRKTLSLAPKECGIIELRERRSTLDLRVHRRPKPFVRTSPVEQASLLPARELKKALRTLGIRVPSGSRRAELANRVAEVDPRELSSIVSSYLRSKYATTSARFVAMTSGRPICADDLAYLRLWSPPIRQASELPVDPDRAFFGWLSSQADDHPLGEVPDDIAASLAA